MTPASQQRSEAPAILVFAKAPIPGQVKTRLVPHLSDDGAALLHRRLAEHAIATAVESGVGRVELWCAPDRMHPFFGDCAARFGVPLHRQAEGSLGTRMAAAARDALNRARCAVLIGCDCPALGPEHLQRAVASLAAGNDAAVVPAEDGGYVLLALASFHESLFEGIAWSTDAVLAQTTERFERLGMRFELATPLWDVDRPADYARLAREFPAFAAGCATGA